MTVIWGNHDYALATKTNQLKVTDYFVQDGILFSHGWKLDASQRFGYFFYKPISEYFPRIYQSFFKTPFECIGRYDVYTESRLGELVRRLEGMLRSMAIGTV